jgi:hypothetical protein
MKNKLLACSAVLVLAGCASTDAPYSLLGATKTTLDVNTFNIGIERVDGSSPMREPIQLAPGPHQIEYSVGGVGAGIRTETLDMKPCVRYFIVGARDPATNAVKLKVDRTEAIPDCKLAQPK